MVRLAASFPRHALQHYEFCVRTFMYSHQILFSQPKMIRFSGLIQDMMGENRSGVFLANVFRLGFDR